MRTRRNPVGVAESNESHLTQRCLRQHWAGGRNRFAVEELVDNPIAG